MYATYWANLTLDYNVYSQIGTFSVVGTVETEFTKHSIGWDGLSHNMRNKLINVKGVSLGYVYTWNIEIVKWKYNRLNILSMSIKCVL